MCVCEREREREREREKGRKEGKKKRLSEIQELLPEIMADSSGKEAGHTWPKKKNLGWPQTTSPLS